MAEPVTVNEEKKRDFPQKSESDHLQKKDNKSSSSPDRETQKVLAVPFRGHISGGMKTGKTVIVMGIVDAKSNRFYIALSCGCGTSKEPPSDVALEICVRFKDRQVLRKACVSGTWGETERPIPFFPFIRDQPFRIDIHCELMRYRVLVDGQQLFDFYHRVTSLKDIDTLWINGGVRITKLG